MLKTFPFFSILSSLQQVSSSVAIAPISHPRIRIRSQHVGTEVAVRRCRIFIFPRLPFAFDGQRAHSDAVIGGEVENAADIAGVEGIDGFEVVFGVICPEK